MMGRGEGYERRCGARVSAGIFVVAEVDGPFCGLCVGLASVLKGNVDVVRKRIDALGVGATREQERRNEYAKRVGAFGVCHGFGAMSNHFGYHSQYD